LTIAISVAPSLRPVRLGARREASREQDGTGVLRVAPCKQHPGGFGYRSDY
jgi:hypothetical protein